MGLAVMAAMSMETSTAPAAVVLAVRVSVALVAMPVAAAVAMVLEEQVQPTSPPGAVLAVPTVVSVAQVATALWCLCMGGRLVMRYKVYGKSGDLVNAIIAGEEFCKSYCAANGYTYEEEVIETPTVIESELTEPEPTEIEQLRADVDYIAVMTGVEL